MCLNTGPLFQVPLWGCHRSSSPPFTEATSPKAETASANGGDTNGGFESYEFPAVSTNTMHLFGYETHLTLRDSLSLRQDHSLPIHILLRLSQHVCSSIDVIA